MAKTSRERLIDTLNHRDPGKVVLDLGSTSITGININALVKLRHGLGMADKVLTMDEPLQLLGRVDEDVRSALGVDVVGISNGCTIFGYRNRDWKEWTLHNGLKMMVSEEFRTTEDDAGNTYIYAKGDTRYPPAGKMPKNGFFFDNITRIVRRVHQQVKAVKPWVKLSSSPIGKYASLPRQSAGGWNCYDAVYQDPQAWLREGIQDLLFPMMYFRGDQFYPFLYDWQEHSYGHPIAPGLGIYLLDPREGRWTLDEVRAQMHTARNIGIGGVIHYRAEFLLSNCKGIYDAVCREFCPYPALMPRMTWTGDTLPPRAPRNLVRVGSFLMWDKVLEGGKEVTYNLYGSNTYPVDTERAENLLRTNLRDTQFLLEGKLAERRYVAVCAMDRFGNQSVALQEKSIQSRPDSKNAWNPQSRIGESGKRMDDRSKLFKSSKWKRLKSASGKKDKKRRWPF